MAWARPMASPSSNMRARGDCSASSGRPSIGSPSAGGATSNAALVKKVSKTWSNRSTSSALLAKVAHRASLNNSRSANPTAATVRWASMASMGDTRTSEARSARKKSSRAPCMAKSGQGLAQDLNDLRLDGHDVLLELKQHVERIANDLAVQGFSAQQDQGTGPIDGLGD